MREWEGGESDQRLPRSTPEEQGLSSAALLAFVRAAEEKIDALHSLMLVRHGHVVAEGWWAPYAAGEPHSLQSVSKSFTSTAVGLAAEEGNLSIDDPVLKFFPDEAPASPSENLKSMTVRDLLRMATGHGAEEHLNMDFPFHSRQDLVRAFLALPVPDKPGSRFVYNSAATYMLSAIVQRITGQTVLEYLRPRVFEPLGIFNPKWEASSEGISFGGFGLSLRTEDVACFGQLYLQRGQWHGRQLIPAPWVDAATSLQISNGNEPKSDFEQGYGYHIWRSRFGTYNFNGAWGQFCVVMPRYDAVLVMTGTHWSMQPALDLVWNWILPAFNDSALPANPEADRNLSAKLAGLTLKTQAAEATSPVIAKIAGRRYIFPTNEQRIGSIEFDTGRNGSGVTIAVHIAGKHLRLECGRGTWTKGTLAEGTGEFVPIGNMASDSGGSIPIATSGAWIGDSCYCAIICRYQTSFISTYAFRFTGDELVLERRDAAHTNFKAMGTNGQSEDKVRLIGRALA